MPTNLTWPLPEDVLVDADLALIPWSQVRTIADVREDLIAACNDPRMVRWTQVPHPYTKDMAEAFLENPGPECMRWALVIHARFSGNIELRLGSAQHRTATFGYNAAPWARGRGAMTRAVRLVSEHAFSHGFHRLVIQAAVDNAASRHVAEQAGYTFEGVIRGGELLHGEFIDHAQYSRLASD
ncbi:GNAT family N-acetyltransferase [Corynebacterium sp. HMSC29G08]|uniref:GNAT family N-acetyltransferase n=1 Tax=Corynebacterium sp. HMSC29G08 TaxID=1581069 RepID=UPI0008A4DFF0|nr:GNAT family protein [Corynebacterium sp. HMSC29G08]OFT86310.1 hypothetical protein HMPREF3101_00915 [Corynebacterium sp. HMSC29G08]